MPRPKTKLNSWDRTVYTEGDCWLLAYELHTLRPDLLITTNCCFDCWAHVAVTKDGWILDINGWSPVVPWLAKWDPDMDPDWEIPTGTARSLAEARDLLCIPDYIDSAFMQTDARRLVIANIVLAIPHPEVTAQLTDVH